jgi:PBSX family phage terminase large subunit
MPAGVTHELYQPRGAARQLWGCADPEILIEGPQGTGKTLAILHKLNALCFYFPGIRILMVRKTRESMTESVLADLEQDVFKDDPAFPDFKNRQRSHRRTYQYPNGSQLVIRGMEDPNEVKSTNFDVVAAFEATELTEADWEFLQGRLRNYKMPYQQGICDCNPDRPSHWLNSRASRPYVVPEELKGHVPEPPPGKMQMTRLLSRHVDNPKLYDHKLERWTPDGAAYLSKLAAMTGSRYERFYKGKWAASEGLVYDFDPERHLLDYNSERFPYPSIPSSWRRIRAIDFGLTNPFVCQWWAIDGDGRMYLYRELYKSQMIVEDHAREIERLTGDEKIEATIADHDREDRETLHRHGVKTVKAWKNILPGIENVEVRLRKAGDDKPRLFLMRNALVARDQAMFDAGLPTCTREEFDGYVWTPGVDGKTKKEEPIDRDNHGLDACRYACAWVDDLAKRRFKLRGGRVGTARQLQRAG